RPQSWAPNNQAVRTEMPPPRLRLVVQPAHMRLFCGSFAPPGCIGGDLLYQLRSNLGQQSRWLERRVALLTMRRGFDRFCPRFPDLLFRDACLLSIHTKTNRGSC